jgi:hypothetical protein
MADLEVVVSGTQIAVLVLVSLLLSPVLIVLAIVYFYLYYFDRYLRKDYTPGDRP